MPGQLHPVGDLAEGGLDAVAPLGDDLQQDGGHRGALPLAWRDEDGGAAAAWAAAKALPLKPLSRAGHAGRARPPAGPRRRRARSRRRARWTRRGRPGCPGPSSRRAGSRRTTRRGRRRGRTGRPGRCPARSTGPAADPGGVLDRQRAGVHLLAVILREPGRERGPQLLERAPQPADPAVGLALARQDREEMAPVAGDLGQETGLGAPPEQVPDLRDGQQLGISAGRSGPGLRGIWMAPDRIRS